MVAAHLRMQSIKMSSPARFLVNAEKPKLVPSKNITYIGGIVLWDKGIVLPTVERISKLQAIVRWIMVCSGTARQYLQMLGLMASCIKVIPYARLHMRPTQLHLLYWWKAVSGDLEMHIQKISASCKSSQMVVTGSKHFQGQIFSTHEK